MEQLLVKYLTTGGNISALLVALVLAGARPLGFVLLCPLFSRFGVQDGIVRGGILLALLMPALPLVLQEFTVTGQPDTGALAFLVGKEVFIGLVLGLLSGLPFWAAAAAGDMIDMSRGSAMGNLIDPGSGSETSVTGTFLFLASVLFLIASGAFFPALFAPLFDTYGFYPIFAPLPRFELAMGAEVLAFLSTLARAGLILALPMILPFLILDVLLAVAGKYIQQLNIMFLAMTVKQAIFVVLLLLYTSILITQAFNTLGSETGNAALLRRYFGGADER